MNPIRVNLVHFTNYIGYVDLTFKTGLPKEIASYLVLMEPFDNVTWNLMLASCVFVAAFLIISDRLYFGYFLGTT